MAEVVTKRLKGVLGASPILKELLPTITFEEFLPKKKGEIIVVMKCVWPSPYGGRVWRPLCQPK